MVSCCFTFNIFEVLFSAFLGEGLDDFVVAVHGSHHQGSPLLVVLGILVGTRSDQQFHLSSKIVLTSKMDHLSLLRLVDRVGSHVLVLV